MPSLSGHSRRALVAATAALTAAPVVTARKKGKKKKKKPPTPLAYAVVADTSVVVIGADFVRVSYRAALYVPAELAMIMETEADVVFADGADSFVAEVQEAAAARFAEAGSPVAADRVSVTVL